MGSREERGGRDGKQGGREGREGREWQKRRGRRLPFSETLKLSVTEVGEVLCIKRYKTGPVSVAL